MGETDIVKELKEVRDRLDKIETFFAHDGFSVMLNEKLSAHFGHMTEILMGKIDKMEKALLRKDQK
jgi:hypothetical protein